MITYTNKSIFELDVDAIVNPVNCVGVMGKGLALEFKNRFPKNFYKYKNVCVKNELIIGKLLFTNCQIPKILNFPTKNHWKDKSELNYIEEGLKTFINEYQLYAIKSIAFPKLGCGLGGLDFNKVQELFEKYLNDLDIKVFICL